MKKRDLKNLLARAAAALETPADLTDEDREALIEDLRGAEDAVEIEGSKLPIQRASESLEELAHQLANENNVEGAWALRGFTNSLEAMFTEKEPKPDSPDLYSRFYEMGRRSAKRLVTGM